MLTDKKAVRFADSVAENLPVTGISPSDISVVICAYTGNALSREQDDLGSLHITPGNGATPGPSFEVDPLLVRDR